MKYLCEANRIYHEKRQILPPHPDKRCGFILDYLDLHNHRCLLSCNRIFGFYLHGRSCSFCCPARTLVVRQCVPARQPLRQSSVQILTAQAQIPGFVRTFGFRLFMVFFIFAVFGIQMYFAWGDWAAMGRVFWRIIVITTIAGVALSFIYAPRTWCSFCPMGTLSAWVTPRKGNLPERYRRVMVSNRCTTKCQTCAKVCPMQLAPYTSKGDKNGLLDKDCLKCGRCVYACPLKVPVLSDAYTGTQN